MNTASQNNANFFCTQKQPEFQANQMLKSIKSEVRKGCTGKIYPYRLASIEPSFELFKSKDVLMQDTTNDSEPVELNRKIKQEKAVVVFHEDDASRYLQGNFDFLKLFLIDSHFSFEIYCTNKRIEIRYVYPAKHRKLFMSCFRSAFPHSEIQLLKSRNTGTDFEMPNGSANLHASFYHPYLPYHRNLYSSGHNKSSAMLELLSSVSHLGDGEWFCYRITIEPSRNNWTINMGNLFVFENKTLDFYAEVNENGEYFIPPVAELKRTLVDKTNPDNLPFYSIIPSVFYYGSHDNYRAVNNFMNRFSFGGKQYREISSTEINIVSDALITDCLLNYHQFMHGHLLNRAEVSQFVQMPCQTTIESYQKMMFVTKGNKIPESEHINGLTLGNVSRGIEKSNVILPYKDVENSLFINGIQGFGKSNLLLNILEQISNNPDYAIILFYFHEFEFVSSFISKIPKSRLKDVIIAMPSLEGNILKCNLVSKSESRIPEKAESLASALELSYAAYGVDVKFSMKHLLTILMYSGGSLSDIYKIMQKDDPIGRRYRNEALKKTRQPSLIEYIKNLESGKEDTRKIENKLQGIYDSEDLATMVSYSGQNMISYKDIAENKKILIWYLGGIGEAGNVFASMQASLIADHFQSYGSSKYKRKPHHKTILAIDEAQRIKANGIKEAIAQYRKFGLSFIISTQMLSGIDRNLREGINLIPSICCFQPTEEDARWFSQKTNGLFSAKDFLSLEKHEMYVRLTSSNNVFMCKTDRYAPGDMSAIDFVIKNSLDKYYYADIKQEISDVPCITKINHANLNKKSISKIILPTKP